MHLSLRLLLSALLGALATLVVFAATAVAAPKEVAYVCKGEDICLLDPDNPSAAAVNLTDNGTTSFDEDPTWSPDGKRLAFVARYTGKNEENIYTMEPDATGNQANIAVQVTHFTNGIVPTNEMAWSPDGSKIAFVRGGASAGSNPLYVVNSDGSSATATKIAEAGMHPTWSPDSAKIAFSHSNQVYLVNPDLSSPATSLAGAVGEEPAWSPDGSRITYGREFHSIEIIGSGGGTPLTITNSSQFAFASWSPSGAQLAYHEQEGENSYFQIVNADGGGKHHLPIVQDLNANGPAPSWSPDGSRLVFQGRDFTNPVAATNEVYIANVDGSGSVTPLTPDQGFATFPAWRPNPVIHPGPQVFTPSQGGSTAPLPGPTIKPKLVWFTNRIPWTPGPPYIPMMSVGCDAAACNVGARGTSSGSRAAGILIAPEPAATTSAKPGKSKKPKAVVVASGKIHVPANQKRTLKLKLTKRAIAVLEKVGKLKMVVTVTITIAGQKPTMESRAVEVFLKPAKAGHGKR